MNYKIKGRSKSSKSFLNGGDIHVGGRTSVCSEAPEQSELGSYYKPNIINIAPIK